MRKILGLITVFLVATPMTAYIPQSTDIDGTVTAMKWAISSFPITWQMNPNVGSNISGSREQAAVFRDSFEEWADITSASISFTEGPATNLSVTPGFDQINLMTTNVTAADFNSTAVGLTGAFSFTSRGLDQFGRTVEFPGQILEADILFNPDTNFSTNDTTPAGFTDLESVMTHEVGHLLGLDHSNILSSSMFPTVLAGVSFPRDTQLDDRIGVSTIYPSSSFSSFGAISGTVRTTADLAVFGAMVVALDPNGQAGASAVTDPNGQFTIQGLPEGTYLIYAEPMNQPFSPTNAFTLDDAWPGNTVNTNFTVRFR